MQPHSLGAGSQGTMVGPLILPFTLPLDTMPFVISPKNPLPFGVSFEQVTPQALCQLSLQEAQSLRLNQNWELGELCDVRASEQSDLRLEGDFSPAFRIGYGMEQGTITIVGDVGAHVGSLMRGGKIEVHGRTGNYLGAEMRGGTICIRGDAGDFVGAAYPGSKRGMNRGEIHIYGRAGRGTGHRMRRGLIYARATGELTAWQMRAGTLVTEQAEGILGHEMSRGTVIALDSQAETPHTFAQSFVGLPPAAPLLSRFLTKRGLPSILKTVFRTYVGDLLEGGRGEIWKLDS